MLKKLSQWPRCNRKTTGIDENDSEKKTIQREATVDLDLREWLLILGPLFILGVLLHGYMRSRKSRNQLTMVLDRSFLSKPGEATDVDDLSRLSAELPSGGARVIPQPVQAATDNIAVDNKNHQADFSDIERSQCNPRQSNTPLINSAADTGPGLPAPDPAPDVTQPEKFIQVHVLALDEQFAGQRLLEVLTESGLVFGEMNIFHKLDAQGMAEFSLASAVEPGEFDMSNIEAFSTPGVTLFLRVHELRNPLLVFDDLLEVAQSIAIELQGEVRDETRSVMTPQAIDRYRQAIKDFQFRHSA